MTNLFNLTDQYQQVYDLITEQGEEQALIDTLESINDALEEKADGYVAVIRSLESDNEAISAEILRLQQRKTSNANSIKRLKESLKEAMMTTGKTKFKTQLNSYSIRNNAPSVDISDETIIPKKFFIKQDPKLDKKAVLQALKDGQKVRGAEIKVTQSLAVR